MPQLETAQAMSSTIGEPVREGTPQAKVAALFGEDQGRFVCTVAEADAEALLRAAAKAGVRAVQCGSVNTGLAELVLGSEEYMHGRLALDTLRDAHEGWLPRYMKGEV